MNTFPFTSETQYITGRAALNVPNDDGSFADWHFDEVFLSGRGKIRIAGIDTNPALDLLGSYGIRECGGVLRKFGVQIPASQKVFSASHVRAILDMLLTSLSKRQYPSHVTVEDMLDDEHDIAQFKAQIQIIKTKIVDPIIFSLLVKWEQTNL